MKPIFCIKDRAVQTFGEPMAMPSQQHAIRWFKDLVNSDPAQSAIARHPDDYDLYYIGEYNDDAAEMIEQEPIELAVRGKDLVNPKE